MSDRSPWFRTEDLYWQGNLDDPLVCFYRMYRLTAHRYVFVITQLYNMNGSAGGGIMDATPQMATRLRKKHRIPASDEMEWIEHYMQGDGEIFHQCVLQWQGETCIAFLERNDRISRKSLVPSIGEMLTDIGTGYYPEIDQFYTPRPVYLESQLKRAYLDYYRLYFTLMNLPAPTGNELVSSHDAVSMLRAAVIIFRLASGIDTDTVLAKASIMSHLKHPLHQLGLEVSDMKH